MTRQYGTDAHHLRIQPGHWRKCSQGSSGSGMRLERRQQQTLLTQLDHERRKLLQLHYRDAIAADLFEDQQRRITRGMATATARLAAVNQVFADIEETLDHALRLGQKCHHAYLAAWPHVRRLMNQAFFEALYISDDDSARSNLAEPFAILLGGSKLSGLNWPR